jgi:threonylcarbamoyladenosine tRNA methylthiotransferase MtaB
MRIYLDTIGCRLNQSEIEAYARQFRAAGHSLVPTPAEADVAVINTCTVTSQAAADSRQKIRQAQRQGAAQIVVTGCWATLEPQAAAALLGVGRVVPNPAKDQLVAQLLALPAEVFDLEPLARTPVPGGRGRTRAFIKAQDGCDNHCTFCITALARGPSRSRPAAAVLADVQAALAGGCQEVVLTGVHLGAWGRDLNPPQHLRHLVQAVLEAAPPRLRLSAVEPWDLDDAFWGLWQDPRLCRQLHLPLQSGSAAVLRRMARQTTPEAYAALLAAARAAIPEAAVTTDLIAGFPGETEAEFVETLAFVQAMQFAGGHVFTYSERPGTAAMRLRPAVPHPVRKARNARLRQALAEAERTYQQRFIGQTLTVLWESAVGLGAQGWELSGLTDNYLRVTAPAGRDLLNHLTPVRLIRLGEDGLIGELA